MLKKKEITRKEKKVVGEIKRDAFSKMHESFITVDITQYYILAPCDPIQPFPAGALPCLGHRCRT